MKERYTFPAIFHLDKETTEVGVTFSDLPGCISQGVNQEHAYQQAAEALSLHLYGMEEEGLAIPTPSNVFDIDLEEYREDGEQVVIVLISVTLKKIRDEMANRAVKKTLTVPKWLNDMAEENNVNFSRVLQDGLKSYLGVDSYQKSKE